jgi:hypothetical protein
MIDPNVILALLELSKVRTNARTAIVVSRKYVADIADNALQILWNSNDRKEWPSAIQIQVDRQLRGEKPTIIRPMEIK